MKTHEINKLKKEYPADRYSVKESQGGRISFSPKKSVVRIFRYQAKEITKNGNATKVLEELLSKTKLKKEDFSQQQVTITKELNNKILQHTAECKTRRIVFLQRLIGDV